MSEMYRTRTMDQISQRDIGSELRIAGWVENIRDHGGVSFIDLRDMYGVMQVVLRDTSLLAHVRKEECLSVKGMIQHRDEETYNPKIPTGTIDNLKLFDLFFLPHFNQPYNYITMAALKAQDGSSKTDQTMES